MTKLRPCTSSQEQTKTRRAQDWIIRRKTRRSGPSETTTKGEGRRHDIPRTGTSGGEQAAGDASPRTGTSEDKWRPRARTGSSGAEHPAGATGSLRSGHEDEAVEMQLSRVEDEAGEKRRRQDEDKARVTQ